MSTVASLQRMTAKTLSEMILAEAGAEETSYAVIDVRDDGELLSIHIPLQPHRPTQIY